MPRFFALRLGASVALLAALAGCNCGRQPQLMQTESSLALASELLDFGVVVEGTSKAAKFRVDNTGRASVGVTAALKAGSSSEFELGVVTPTVEAQGFIEVLVTYTPVGPGEDEGFVEVQSAQPDTLPLTLRLHGGPIAPAVAFEPDPVDFNPSTMLLETRMAKVKSVGTSALNVRAIGVAANGNPDFSVVPPALPARLLPGESLNVRVDYARSARATEGRMEVLSDAQDAGLAWLRLIPDPPAACANGLDDDMDGLTDFPNDPGCQDADDDDEYNPAQCINGATQPCGGNDAGTCGGGTRTCMNSVWTMCSGMQMPQPEVCNNQDDDCDGMIDDGVTRACYTGPAGTRGIGACRDGLETCSNGVWPGTCLGQVTPASSDICGNGVDDDCNGVTDETCDAGTTCNPNGIFRVDAGIPIAYQCCDYLGLGLIQVDINISQFSIGSNGTTVVPAPTQPGTSLNPTATVTCPTGSFTATRVIPGGTGGCTETYTLTGTWTSANTFNGTYTASFSGAQCTSSLCGSLPCTNQSWTFQGGR